MSIALFVLYHLIPSMNPSLSVCVHVWNHESHGLNNRNNNLWICLTLIWALILRFLNIGVCCFAWRVMKFHVGNTSVGFLGPAVSFFRYVRLVCLCLFVMYSSICLLSVDFQWLLIYCSALGLHWIKCTSSMITTDNYELTLFTKEETLN